MTPRIFTGNGVTCKCNVCKTVKPMSEFYDHGSRTCKVCTKNRSVRWRAEHPESAKATDRKYKASEKGKATVRNGSKRWYRNNTSRVYAYVARYRESLPDAFVGKCLKDRYHVENPTPKQIEAHRRLIQILRARKTLTFITYATRNPQR